MEAARKGLHTTAAQLSQLLGQFANLAAQANTSYSSSGVLGESFKQKRDELTSEIDSLFSQFSSQIDTLQNLHSTSHPPPSTSAVHALERHRDVYSEYRREYQRTKGSIRDAEQRASLLGSVREEIIAFKSSSSNSATDALLNDRQHIDSSHRMTDDILNQAYATRSAFHDQSDYLRGINSRISGVASQIPALNSIIGMINSRRRRDSLILGTVIGICVVILLWIMWR